MQIEAVMMVTTDQGVDSNCFVFANCQAKGEPVLAWILATERSGST